MPNDDKGAENAAIGFAYAAVIILCICVGLLALCGTIKLITIWF